MIVRWILALDIIQMLPLEVRAIGIRGLEATHISKNLTFTDETSSHAFYDACFLSMSQDGSVQSTPALPGRVDCGTGRRCQGGVRALPGTWHIQRGPYLQVYN